MKKILILIAVGVIVLAGAFFLLKGQKTTGEKEAGSTGTSKKVVLPIEERPFATLTPRTDGHALTLDVKNIKGANVVEYELPYMAGDASRGTLGDIKLNGETSFSRNLLLGSESCSGTGEKQVCKYKYDEGVSDGSLTLRLRGSNGTQKYDTDFRLQKGSEAKIGLVSKDGNFQFQGTLPANVFYVVLSTIGLPQATTGKVVGGPYGVFTAGSNSAKGTIKITLTEPAQSVKALGWDGLSWKEYSKGLTSDGKTVSVEVDRLTTFVVVAP